MGFFYDRIVSVTRPATHGGGGKLGYGGETRATNTLIASAVPANIYPKAAGRTAPVGIPSDVKMAKWVVDFPMGAVADGLIRDGDIITDDLGRVFGVTADFMHALGATLSVDRLEA